VITIAAGLIVGAIFLRRQRSLSYPLVDVSLFRSPTFAIACAALLVSVFVVSGTDLFVAQYLQLVHSVNPFTAGLWLLPAVISIIIGSMVAPYITRRFSSGTAVAASLTIAAAGLLVLTQLDPTSDLTVLVSGTSLIGLGAGVVGTLGTDIVVAAAPPERAGAASAISETATELGGAIGIAILGSVGTAVYRDHLATSAPTGLSAARAHGAQDSLGQAVDVAHHLSTQLGDALLHVARDAFTRGLNIAAVVGAATAIVIALLAALQLRDVRAET
jgi:DHA2 family multidrug resistance protein-like MFS transporter